MMGECFDGRARTCKPIGESTVMTPLRAINGIVVDVVDVLVVGAAVATVVGASAEEAEEDVVVVPGRLVAQEAATSPATASAAAIESSRLAARGCRKISIELMSWNLARLPSNGDHEYRLRL